MAKAKCDYCDHEFTDEELDQEGKTHLALGNIEIRCPVCFSYSIISYKELGEIIDNESS